MGRFRDITNVTLMNKINGIRLESGPPEPVGDELIGGCNSWVTCAEGVVGPLHHTLTKAKRDIGMIRSGGGSLTEGVH